MICENWVEKKSRASRSLANSGRQQGKVPLYGLQWKRKKRIGYWQPFTCVCKMILNIFRFKPAYSEKASRENICDNCLIDLPCLDRFCARH